MANFEPAFQKTMGHEGGYSNDPVDQGGETYRGVARRFHPDWPGWKIIDSQKNNPNFPKILDGNADLQNHVKRFYKDTFWSRFQGDALPDQGLAEELFDTAVNMGVHKAIAFLQQSLNALNRNAFLFPDMPDDGILGNTTLGAIRKIIESDGSARILLVALNVLQGAHYLSIMKQSPTQERFARGWLGRVQIEKT